MALQNNFTARALPLAALSVLAVLSVALWNDPAVYFRALSSELGLIESATVAFALVGAAGAFWLFANRRRLPHPPLGWWFGFFGLGLVFLAGEEASWGQHWFGWDTGETFEGNLQNETNFHNMSQIAEQVPKNLLALSALIGGIVWPIYAALKKRAPVLGGWFGWVFPDARIWIAAAIAWSLRIPDRLLVAFDLDDGALRPLFVANKEAIELFLVLFLVAYVFSIVARMNAPAAALNTRTVSDPAPHAAPRGRG